MFFSDYIIMETRTENEVIKTMKGVRELFNEVRNNFSREEGKKIRKKCIERNVSIKHY